MKRRQWKKNYNTENKCYKGTLDTNKMSSRYRCGYWVFQRQNRTSVGALYSSREFLYWYYKNTKHLNLGTFDIGRLDHSKPYSFDNIAVQSRLENNRERNARCGNPAKKKPVNAISIKTDKVIRKFNSKLEAASYYMISQKTVYNHCADKTKEPYKYGTKRKLGVYFQWA